ncbi:MAG TPA: VOC family protein [Candidatus Binataceae bacterium]
MFRGIDHFVVAVRDLDAAIASFTQAGFSVARGGRHNIGTENALFAFADSSYVELIAFLNPASGHPWQRALEHGGGVVDFCMQTDDLAADIEALRRAGAKINDPSAMTRRRPDGYVVSWVLGIPAPPFNGQVPFLIKDETPRDERMPHERTHRNGVTGIQSITIAVDDPGATSVYYARVLGRPGVPLQRPDLDAAGVAFAIGPHQLQLVAPKSAEGALAEWIRARGQSPYEVKLKAAGGAPQLDPALLQGARISIA